MESTAKCVSVDPAHCRERLQNPVRFSSASIQQCFSHSGGPRAGSGNGTRSRHSLEKRGHRGGLSPRKRVRVLQPVLHSSKEGWGVASDFKSVSAEPLSHATEVQDADTQTGHVSDQVRRLVCHDRSKGHILLCLHPSHSREVPEVCFRRRSLPVSGSSVWPSTLTPHFHEMCGCCVSSVAATGHPHTQLNRRLVDSRSVRADGGLASICRSCPHESAGVKTERQEKCGFSGSENHLSGRDLGFDHDAGTYVTCSDRVDPHCSHESESKRSPCVGAHRQHRGSLLHQPPRRSAFTPPVQAGIPDPWVVPDLLAESSSHSWASQYLSRHPVEAGAEARGTDTSPRCGEAELESD